MSVDINKARQQYGIRPEAKEFPMMCVISFVYVCNASCPNCPYTLSDIRESFSDKPFMEQDTFKIIADQCGKYGAYIRISGGGEPMLHPQAQELLVYAKEVGAKVGLITNGSLFNKAILSRLISANIDVIEFSADAGDMQTYERVRPGLDWENLVHNVELAVEIRNRLRGKTKIIVSAINQKGVDIDQVEKFWQSRVDNFQKRKFLTWGIGNPEQSADITPYLDTRNTPCPFIFERLNIDSRGNVMVCGYDIAAKTNFGNVHEKSIKEIWHGEDFEYYRQIHLSGRGKEIVLCKECPDWQYRSWTHNYWNLVKEAEKTRQEKTSDRGEA